MSRSPSAPAACAPAEREPEASRAQASCTPLLDAVLAQPQPPLPAAVDGVALGRLEAPGADGSARVTIATLNLQSVPARSLVPLPPERAGQTVALGFEGGDPQRPLILGFLYGEAAAETPATPADTLEVRVDGERTLIEAREEIELRCGEAVILLTADGRIHLRGTYITSEASATQRILGGSVNVN